MREPAVHSRHAAAGTAACTTPQAPRHNRSTPSLHSLPAHPPTLQMGGPLLGSSTSSAGPTPARAAVGVEGISEALPLPPRGDACPPETMLGVGGAVAGAPPPPAPPGPPPLASPGPEARETRCGEVAAAAAPEAGDSGCGLSSKSCTARACGGKEQAVAVAGEACARPSHARARLCTPRLPRRHALPNTLPPASAPCLLACSNSRRVGSSGMDTLRLEKSRPGGMTFMLHGQERGGQRRQAQAGAARTVPPTPPPSTASLPSLPSIHGLPAALLRSPAGCRTGLTTQAGRAVVGPAGHPRAAAGAEAAGARSRAYTGMWRP